MPHPQLTLLMQNYYHQEWHLDYDNHQETIAEFKRDYPQLVDELAGEISAILLSGDEAATRRTVIGAGSQIGPGRSTYLEWLSRLLALLKAES